MISFKQADSNEIKAVLGLLDNSSGKEDDQFEQIRMAKLYTLLFGPSAYHKVILGKDDGVPFAICVYHYRNSLLQMRRGIAIDLLYVKPGFENIGAQACLLQVLCQKIELEGLSFLEMDAQSPPKSIPNELISSPLSKNESVVRVRVDDGLYTFCENLSNCPHCE